uniref:Protein KRI1 homolog n=1 Tax=Acrobeloides nanus TaxID=290746 RepID=A0A914BUM9_9BILA
MPKIKLDLSSDDEGESLKINDAYANRYDNWRRLEEMQKLKDKHGKDADKMDEDEESEDESTDSDELIDWSAEKERGFLRTYAALKAKDPRIYKDDVKFFNEEERTSNNDSSNSASPSKKEDKKKSKSMFLRDYEQKLVVERGGKFSDDEEDDEEMPKSETYFEQQNRIKEEIQTALKDADESDEDDELLKRRIKTAEEKKHEEDEYYEWLNGQDSTTLDIQDDNLKKLKETWSKPDLGEEDKFLKNYLTNRLYEEDEDAELPTYEEIVEMDQQDEKAAEFEHKYNFRYEEPDQEFIKQYPRTVKESVRQGNEKRKAKRESRKERKKEEKRQKKEEIKQLKSMKRKELEEMLKKVRDVTGDPNLPITVDDLEKEFDPDEYSRRMEALFNSEYYSNVAGDDEKPMFSDSEADNESDYDQLKVVGGEILDSSSNGHKESSAEEQEEESDGEPQPETSSGRSQKSSRRKRKRNAKFLEIVAKKKPLFDPKEKNFDEYFKEYYGLDYEDIIAGDLITRFKYRNVPANNFGLTAEEILSVEDKQLNAWVSVKKASQYRSEQEEKLDLIAYQRKAQNLEKKQKILGKLNQSEPSDEKKPKLSDDKPTQQKANKNKSKKKKQHASPAEPPAQVKETHPKPTSNGNSTEVKKDKKARRKNKSKKDQLGGLTKERLQAYGVSTKNLKRRLYVQNQSAKNLEK